MLRPRDGSTVTGTRLEATAVGTRHEGAVVGLSLLGLALAVTVRVVVAGPDGARSAWAGVIFGVILLVLAGALGLSRSRGHRWSWRRSAGLWGLGGAVVLCLPPLARHLGHQTAPGAGHQLAVWAAVVTLVAAAEEVLLRGSLFDAVTRWRGENTAVAVSAVAFALLHVPVYGWSVLPLDLAVGVALGVLRIMAGTVTAPVLTHVIADLAGWWLR